MRTFPERPALPCLILLLALLLPLTAQATELLPNGGFESLDTAKMPENWAVRNWGDERFGNGKVVAGRFGRNALQLEGTGAPILLGAFSHPLTLDAPVPGELLLSFYYRTTAAPQAEVLITTFAEDFTAQEWKTPVLTNDAVELSPASSWRPFAFRVRVLPSARQVVLMLRIHRAGKLQVDNVSLQQYPALVACEVLSPSLVTTTRGTRECRLRLSNSTQEPLPVKVQLQASAPKGPKASANASASIPAGQSEEVTLRYNYPLDRLAELDLLVTGSGDEIYDHYSLVAPGLIEGRLVRPAFRNTLLPSLPASDLLARGRLNASPDLRRQLKLQARLTGLGVLSDEFAAAEDGTWEVTLPATGLLAAPYAVQITASDSGAVVGTVDLPLLKLDDKSAQAGYDERLRLWAQGKPMLPVGLYSALDKADFAAAAEAGFNTLVLPARAAGLSIVEEATRLGLSTIVSSPNADDGFWQTMVSKYGSDPAVIGWQLLRRPEALSPPAHPAAVADLYARLARLDPRRPITLTLGTLSRLEPYAPWCDVIMPWTEPLPAGDLRSVDALLQRALAVAGGSKPVWPVLQITGAGYATDSTMDVAGSGRPPTPDEYRCMVYLAFARGATGFFAHAYRVAATRNRRDFSVQRDAPELWEMVKRVGQEIKSLTPVLLEGEPVAMECDQADLPLRGLKYNGVTYILAANPTGQKLPVSFRVPGLTGDQLEVAFDELRVKGLPGGQFADLLDPNAVRVYMAR